MSDKLFPMGLVFSQKLKVVLGDFMIGKHVLVKLTFTKAV